MLNFLTSYNKIKNDIFSHFEEIKMMCIKNKFQIYF